MDYPYEQLGPERFQQFCQALLVRELPGVQCLPVAQPDGGRDALQSLIFEGKSGLAIFQVKFARQPTAIRDPHKWLIDILKEEAPKVAGLLPHEATYYYLMTNVSGTAHLQTGSVDTLQDLLDAQIPIPAQAWWRDDLNRRLDNATDLRWAYWELIKAPDLLRSLIESGLGEARARRFDATRAFVVKQHELDEQVRFKQIELENELLDLFVDVPTGLRQGPGDRRSRHVDRLLIQSMAQSADGSIEQSVEDEYEEQDLPQPYRPRRLSVGAAALLLSETGQDRFPLVVLDGAPGQGKSTLVQYMCQLYRLLLLGRTDDLNAVPHQHRPASARLPIKVDLREYAAWVGGLDPFAEEYDEKRPAGTTKSLESFIAALISNQSGGSAFDVSDLQALARTSSLLLVLDGLDEVAEISRREEVAGEIASAVKRLNQTAASLQTIITTRPSALADISGFSPRTYHHFTLLPLTKGLVDDYAVRWTRAKRLEGRQAARLRRIFKHRLNQPHLADLSKNPMQLAILLSVINAREDSFPDKRTALYDMYVEIFLARESAKSDVVRVHREMLIDVHMYLAWLLHAGAETGQELGRIDQDHLLTELKAYLSREGRDPALAEELFGGVTQRVVFLVQRVEGTYEFEVQPLREYFAGRYLYETAPHSPPGRERKGTKPDRFDGLARNPYWLNVTRFFSGCFSKGEQPALAERLYSLAEDPDYRVTGYPRVLAATLVGDWVFAQNQRSLRAVIDMMTAGAGFRQLLYASESRQVSGPSLRLPEGSGRRELLDRCFEALATVKDGDVAVEASRLARVNASTDELMDRWSQYCSSESSPSDKVRWLHIAYWLGILPAFQTNGLNRLIEHDREVLGPLLERLLSVDQVKFIEEDEIRTGMVLNLILDGNHNHIIDPRTTALSGFVSGLSLVSYYPVFAGVHERLKLSVARTRAFAFRHTNRASHSDKVSGAWTRDHMSEGMKRIEGILKLFDEMSDEPIATWRSSLRPWNTITEAVRARFGERWAVQKLAAMASGVGERPSASDGIALFDESIDLCVRARAARMRAGNLGWWRGQLAAIQSPSHEAFWVLMALHCCGPTTLAALIKEIDSISQGWSQEQFGRVLTGLQEVGDWTRWRRPDKRAQLPVEEFPDRLKARAVVLVATRGNLASKVSMYERFLAAYRGKDQLVEEFRQDVLIRQAARNADVWDKLVKSFQVTYQSRGFVERSRRSPLAPNEDGDRTMPLSVARRVASDDDQYPVDLVVMAQSRCQQALGERIEPLAVVAEREGWFADEV